jgi:IS5 family transposase
MKLPQQLSFSQAEYSGKKKQTRRDRFLAEMEQLVPWERLLGVIAPHYGKPAAERKSRAGRPQIALEIMLRLYFLQQWYALADEALEDALYDSQALRQFARIDLNRQSVPDATTLLHFRHLLEQQQLTQALFAEINTMLSERGLLMRAGTIVDATIIAAPPSTKNQDQARDPEMQQTRKGNQWYFGMKAHIGVDAESGLVHSLSTTSANVADINQTHALLHGGEQDVHADAGYIGVDKRAELAQRPVTWHIARKRGQIKALPEGEYKTVLKQLEKVKAQIRAAVEHPFHVVKNLFRHRKTRYRGLAKNTAQLYSLFGLANLVLAKRALLAGSPG